MTQAQVDMVNDLISFEDPLFPFFPPGGVEEGWTDSMERDFFEGFIPELDERAVLPEPGFIPERVSPEPEVNMERVSPEPGFNIESDTESEDERAGPGEIGPRFNYEHRLVRPLEENSVVITGFGVETVFGRVRVPESICKSLIKVNLKFDYMTKISHENMEIRLTFFLPGHRQPRVCRYSYMTDLFNKRVNLVQFISIS